MSIASPDASGPDLAAWLLEQIAEDERTVQAVLKRTRNWKQIDLPWWRVRHGTPEYRAVLQPEEMLLAVCGPDRLLAECDAKRRIIEQYRAIEPDDTGSQLWQAMQRAERSTLLETLRFLALPYADREGYREEWRP